jgi:arabinofuranosyltransferase
VVIIVAMGWTHRWCSDDSYIDFRIVRNLITGHGPVYNIGQRVEADTNPLWVGILAFFAKFLSFVVVQWWAVLLGIAFTAIGFFAAGMAAMSLGARHSRGLILPVGMLCASVVDAMWQFTTSGLETGLAFGWLGLSWWMMVVPAQKPKRRLWIALFLGLGPLIRPEFILYSSAFFGCLLAIELRAFRARRETRSMRKSVASLVVALVILPGLYEIFRMGYYGLLVPNTALTKGAGSANLGQGIFYLRDFLRPNILLIPLIILGVITIIRCRAWWNEGVKVDAALVVVPAIAGLANAAYVIYIGGDFMHARMLLPALFSILMVSWIDTASRLERRVPMVLLLGWAALNLFSLRYGAGDDTNPAIAHDAITNERAFYIAHSENQHPITPQDFMKDSLTSVGLSYAKLANSLGGSKTVLAFVAPTQTKRFPATTALPELLYAPEPNIGLVGWFAGPKVFIFDTLGLANPIGSHLSGETEARPGHSRWTSEAWMIGEFTSASINGQLPLSGRSGTSLWTQKSIPTHFRVESEAARGALACEPLSGILSSVEDELTFGRFASNFFRSFSRTSAEVPNIPSSAAKQSCTP